MYIIFKNDIIYSNFPQSFYCKKIAWCMRISNQYETVYEIFLLNAVIYK